MTTPSGSSNDPRLAAVDADFATKRTRLFLTFAVIEGLVILALVLIIYVFAIIDPDQGIWIILVLAMLGGFTLAAQIVSLGKQHQRARKDITGEL